MYAVKRVVLFMLVWSLAGCDTEPDSNNGFQNDLGSDTSSAGTADGQTCNLGDLSAVCMNGPLGTVQLLDANNYQFTSSLNISSQVVKGGSPLVDLTFDWSAVTQDFMGHALNPLTDIDMALVTLWHAGQPEMKQMLDNDSLDMSKFVAAVMAYPNDQFTSENLLDFTMYGTPIVAPADVQTRDSYFNSNDEGYSPEEYTHMMLVQRTSDNPGKDIAMIQFFTLDSNSPNTNLVMTNESSTLDYSVNLKNLNRIPVAPGNPGLTINWENLGTNAMGRPFVPTMINRVVVAHYSMSVCDLETQFLDVEMVHDQWYEGIMENVGVEYNLALLKDANGVPFSGITGDGLWIVALFCNEEKCSNPAPHFLGILHAC